MTRTIQTQLLQDFQNEMTEILTKKGSDYATHDVLSNFKQAGYITNTSPELNCLGLIATKVARLGKLLKSKEKPRNEAIKDSVLDMANYCFLLNCILEEKENKKSKSINKKGRYIVQEDHIKKPLLYINEEKLEYKEVSIEFRGIKPHMSLTTKSGVVVNFNVDSLEEIKNDHGSILILQSADCKDLKQHAK